MGISPRRRHGRRMDESQQPHRRRPTTGAFPSGRSRFASTIDLFYDRGAAVRRPDFRHGAGWRDLDVRAPVGDRVGCESPAADALAKPRHRGVTSRLGAALHNKEFFADRPELFTPGRARAPGRCIHDRMQAPAPLPADVPASNGKLFDAGPSLTSQLLTGQTVGRFADLREHDRGGSAAMYRPGMIFKCGAVPTTMGPATIGVVHRHDECDATLATRHQQHVARRGRSKCHDSAHRRRPRERA